MYVPAFVALRLPETTLKSLFRVSVLPLTTIVVVWLFALYVSDFAVADLTSTLAGDDVAANATVGTIIAIHTTIAKSFFKSKYMEKHLSMFKNGNYAEYFFGNEPNRSSIGFELLERESNLVFLDEIDKCPEMFYSAFYTLFDNTVFKDYTYDVDISGVLIILTANYTSMEEMKTALGLPIFYRIDKFIHFDDFSKENIYRITKKEIHDRKPEYSEFFTEEDLYKFVSPRIKVNGENARTIKNKIQFAIEELMFQYSGCNT